MNTQTQENQARIRLTLGLFIFAVIFVWILAGCDPPLHTPEDHVQAPEVKGPNVDAPTPLNPGEETGISLTVSKAAGAKLSYMWNVDVGGGKIVKGQGKDEGEKGRLRFEEHRDTVQQHEQKTHAQPEKHGEGGQNDQRRKDQHH